MGEGEGEGGGEGQAEALSCDMREARPTSTFLSPPPINPPQGLIAAGATALFATDLAAIVFTPLLQNFPITFNLLQGFVLCLAGDTYFQVPTSDFSWCFVCVCVCGGGEGGGGGWVGVCGCGCDLKKSYTRAHASPPPIYQNEQILEQGGLGVKRVGVKAWRTVRSGLIGALNNGETKLGERGMDVGMCVLMVCVLMCVCVDVCVCVCVCPKPACSPPHHNTPHTPLAQG